MKFKWIKWGMGLVAVLLAAELVVRFALGYPTIPTYTSSDVFEYIYSPDQVISYPEGEFRTNHLGLRSTWPTEKDSLLILKVGDSIINGGRTMPNDQLATTMVDTALERQLGMPVHVMNLSMGSWGPDNAYGFYSEYLKDVELDAIVLIFSTHDLYDSMKGIHRVGKEYHMVTEPPISMAWQIFKEKVMSKFTKPSYGEKYEVPEYLRGGANGYNGGFRLWYQLAQQHDVPIAFYHHCTISELKSGLEWQNDWALKLEEHLSAIGYDYVVNGKHSKLTEGMYKDDIHLNAQGQVVLSKVLAQIALDLIASPER